MTSDRNSSTTQRLRHRRRLATVLACIFAFAVVMGPGPGIYLVNPDPGDPQSTATVATVPILYLWALFWFAVQASVVIVAYVFLWDSSRDPDRETSS